MAKYKLRVEIDQKALEHAVSFADGMRDALTTKTNELTSKANAMGAGFRTGRFYDRDAHELRGNTQPEYGGDVQKGNHGYIGLVHPKNYAAMKDCYLHNTLLKVR